MDILITVVCLVVVLSVLVFIHEGGHYLAARACGVRVTEFMLGLPGPNVGFTWHGTKFGVTAVPLGGYARVCGMEADEESPFLKDAMTYVHRHGSATAVELARYLGTDEDGALAALIELDEWGTVKAGKRTDDKYYDLYYAVADDGRGVGAAREVPDPKAFYEAERSVQYRSKGFLKRIFILLAGPGMNLLFAILAFVLIYSVMGFDVIDNVTQEITHVTVSVDRAVTAGFNYIGMVFMAILGLFNPQTAADTVSNSTSVVGIAVLSKAYFEAGFENALMFMAMISVSLGLMNMLPIPPLDGGRFLVEIWQLVTRRAVSTNTLGFISLMGMTLFMLFFLFMLNQDIQRFVFGNW